MVDILPASPSELADKSQSDLQQTLAGIAILGMITWSLLQWPEMQPSIVTREAAGNHGTSTVPRAVTVSAMPAALVLVTGLLAFAPRIDGRYLKLLGNPGTANMHNRTGSPRVLGLLLIGFSVLLATVHVALVSLHTLERFPVMPLISTAVGVFLILLSIALPLVRPETVTGTDTEERLRSTQRHSHRRAAPIGMFPVGAATIITAWLAPALTMPIATGGIVIIFGVIATTAILKAWRA